MNILAIDTCFAACSVAVLRGGGDVFSDFRVLGTGHAEALMPMVESTLAAAGLTFAMLDRLAVSHGPGSFTGTRIGLAAARGFALATDCPLVAASSLHVMALSAADTPTVGRALARCGDKAELCVAVDARRDQLYTQRFSANGRLISQPMLQEIRQCRRADYDGVAVIVGSGGSTLVKAIAQDGFTPQIAMLPDLLPNAVELAKLAPHLAVPARTPSPLYLRPPDAKPQTGKAIARV